MKSLFASNVLEVLSVLVLAGNEYIHQSEIATQAGLHLVQVQRALQRLSDAGIIEERSTGNMVSYKLDQHHPIYHDLKALIYKTVLITDPFIKALAPVATELELVFIYGSFASGTETSESDIDLFVVGDLTLKRLSGILSPIAKSLHREINPVVYSKDEFIKKVKLKDHFITTVLNSNKLWIVGDQHGTGTMDK